jgi:hypothetical protein
VRGHTRLVDYTANDAPHHMPRIHSPKSPPRQTPSPPVPSSSTIVPCAGLETFDKDTRADTLAGIYTAFFGDNLTPKERQNKCSTCKHCGHFYTNCQVPHYACTDTACYVADTHAYYTSAPCSTAVPYVATMLAEEDEHLKAKWV